MIKSFETPTKTSTPEKKPKEEISETKETEEKRMKAIYFLVETCIKKKQIYYAKVVIESLGASKETIELLIKNRVNEGDPFEAQRLARLIERELTNDEKKVLKVNCIKKGNVKGAQKAAELAGTELTKKEKKTTIENHIKNCIYARDVMGAQKGAKEVGRELTKEEKETLLRVCIETGDEIAKNNIAKIKMALKLVGREELTKEEKEILVNSHIERGVNFYDGRRILEFVGREGFTEEESDTWVRAFYAKKKNLFDALHMANKLPVSQEIYKFLLQKSIEEKDLYIIEIIIANFLLLLEKQLIITKSEFKSLIDICSKKGNFMAAIKAIKLLKEKLTIDEIKRLEKEIGHSQDVSEHFWDDSELLED